jgi:hypothetical protein
MTKLDIGMTASSWLMCQLYGTKSAVPRMIMPAMVTKLKLKENQKFLKVLLFQLLVPRHNLRECIELTGLQ